ncbi:hypothetical protein Jab_2c20080 [Janthinobacterium sp. HH01]|uniref:hypothetical protein n=1 Tax=Janthinobacterium sp. HH01 TaxID=1198452 RepID=UPI0002AEA59C|nr:hypothetical protein [Janthinobacterium sp. HH01]ELX09924.1 hypothetical protein Jab_2c20080 [Janthinobacterium sp. HH01]
MTKDGQYALLSVSFDADQSSSNLNWSLTEAGGNARPSRGAAAGAVQFYQGESVFLQVAGGAAASSDFSAFQIVECCLVTRPQMISCGPGVPTRYATPSPFLQSLGASYVFENDYTATVSEDTPGGYRTITQIWKRSLDIEHLDGSWELSLNLTVRILRGQAALPELRVFRFDPEVQVGNGTRPG